MMCIIYGVRLGTGGHINTLWEIFAIVALYLKTTYATFSEC